MTHIETDTEYTCDVCGQPVGPERILVLTDVEQVARHPGCHSNGAV